VKEAIESEKIKKESTKRKVDFENEQRLEKMKEKRERYKLRIALAIKVIMEDEENE